MCVGVGESVCRPSWRQGHFFFFWFFLFLHQYGLTCLPTKTSQNLFLLTFVRWSFTECSRLPDIVQAIQFLFYKAKYRYVASCPGAWTGRGSSLQNADRANDCKFIFYFSSVIVQAVFRGRRYMTVDVPPFRIDERHSAEVLRAADVLDL